MLLPPDSDLLPGEAYATADGSDRPRAERRADAFAPLRPPREPGTPRLRIALFAPQFPEYSLEYARAMASWCDVRVVLDAQQVGAEYSGRDLPARDLVDFRLVNFRRPFDVLTAIVWLLSAHPDVLHVQEPAALRKLMLSGLVATLFRPFALFVLTVHDPMPHPGADSLVARRSTMARRWLRERAAAVVLHGSACRRTYRRHQPVPGQRLIVSAHGLILRPAEPTPAAAMTTLKILFFGRMEAYKGLGILLDAAAALDRMGVDFSLVVAGTGAELDRLRSRFQAIPQVEIEDAYLRSNRVISLIRDCHCVVLPYLSATQSGVLSAAFAGGRFVVASRVGGLKDVVRDGKNGLLVPPGDAPALARALRRAAEDATLREQLCAGAEHTAATVLHWSGITRSLHGEFASLCSSGREARSSNNHHGALEHEH